MQDERDELVGIWSIPRTARIFYIALFIVLFAVGTGLLFARTLTKTCGWVDCVLESSPYLSAISLTAAVSSMVVVEAVMILLWPFEKLMKGATMLKHLIREKWRERTARKQGQARPTQPQLQPRGDDRVDGPPKGFDRSTPPGRVQPTSLNRMAANESQLDQVWR